MSNHKSEDYKIPEYEILRFTFTEPSQLSIRSNILDVYNKLLKKTVIKNISRRLLKKWRKRFP
jgi:hypothetical protein